MEAFLLIFMILILMLIALMVNKNDLFSPSMLLIYGYLITSVFCILNTSKWGLVLNTTTIWFLGFGILSFIIGELIFNVFHKPKIRKTCNNVWLDNFKINSLWLIIFVLFDAILLYFSIRDLINAYGSFSSFAKMIGVYRKELNYGDSTVASSLVVQMRKISKPIAFICLFDFINGFFKKKKEVRVLFLIPIIMHIFATLMTGGRNELIAFSVSIVFLTFFENQARNNWKLKFKFKSLIKVALLFVIFCFVFYGLQFFLGRNSNDDIFSYISKYIGSSIYLLNDYLMDSSRLNTGGTETFPGIFSSLSKIGLNFEYIHKSLEFRSTNTGIYLGNIYTGLRRNYSDFGLIGLFICQFLMSYLFNYLYYKIKNINQLNSKNIFILLLYTMLVYTLVVQAMEDAFWMDLSIGFITELIIAFVVYFIIINFRYSSGVFILYSNNYRNEVVYERNGFCRR